MIGHLPPVGTSILDKYRLDHILGEGGFARVYRATDLKIDRAVAIKILKPSDAAAYERASQRFLREMRVVASLAGPHVVRMFDFGRTETGLLFMVFELLGGTDLEELMAQGPMREDAVIHVMKQVLDALSEAHKLGLLHRDVKPANIRVFEYMDDPLRVKLIDFGIARNAGGDNAALTATGMVVGTPRFMAPEQLFGAELAPSADLYSLALVAFEMLTGRPSDHMKRFANGEAVRLLPDDPVSHGLATVLDRMLSREPSDRFQSADEVVDALGRRDAQVGGVSEGVDERQARGVEDSGPQGQALRQLAPYAAAALLVLAIVLGVWGIGDEPDRAEIPAGRRPVPSLVAAKTDQPEVAPEPPPQSSATPDVGFDLARRDMPAASGCGHEPPFVGTGTTRTMKGLSREETAVHIPRGYKSDQMYPVVLLFHDDLSSGAEVLRQTQFGATADKHGFVVIAPNDVDPTHVWSGADDLALAHTSLLQLGSKLCLDLEHVYAVGYGSGASAVEHLSCETWIHAGAAASYILTEARFRCEPQRPIPMLWLAPTRTGFQPVEGGKDCWQTHKISFDEYESMWRERNHCRDSRPTTFATHGQSKCLAWSCDDNPFVSCRIDAGRVWPGAPRRASDLLRCDGPDSNFPQNEVIWRFLSTLR